MKSYLVILCIAFLATGGNGYREKYTVDHTYYTMSLYQDNSEGTVFGLLLPHFARPPFPFNFQSSLPVEFDLNSTAVFLISLLSPSNPIGQKRLNF